MVYSVLQIILGSIGVDIGYIAFINGSGVTVEIDEMAHAFDAMN